MARITPAALNATRPQPCCGGSLRPTRSLDVEGASRARNDALLEANVVLRAPQMEADPTLFDCGHGRQNQWRSAGLELQRRVKREGVVNETVRLALSPQSTHRNADAGLNRKVLVSIC